MNDLSGDLHRGLKDFWSVYGGCYAEMQAKLSGPLKTHPTFGPLVASQPKEQQDAQRAQSRKRLAKAIETDDWAEYDSQLRDQGAFYASLGIGFRDWYDIVRLVARYMVPKVTAAFLAEPERLVPALQAQREFFDHSMAVIGEAYVERLEAHLSTSLAAARDVTEQKQASQYARSLIEASLDPLVTISPEGKITDVNDATIKVTGVPREKLVGTDFSDYFTEPEQAREGYQQVFARGSVTDYPLTIRHKDGRLTDVLYNASVYKDGAGSVLGAFAAARDVTESKRVMREFSETQNLLDNILESSIKYSIIGKDLDHRILSWNEGAKRNYGYTAEQILGRNSEILHTPEDIQAGVVDRLLKSAYDDGLAEGEFMRMRKDGTRFAASVVVTRRNDAAGNPVGFLLMSSDISEKRQAEEQLKREVAERARLEDRFRRLVDSVPNALVIVDQEGRITLVNARAVEWFDYTREELLGQPVEVLVPTRFRDQHPALRRSYLADPVMRPMGTGRELFARRKDGSEFPVDVSLSAVEGDEGIEVIAAISDMTERKRTEEALRAANRELEAFSYSVSHDLRAPLRSVDGFSQALLEDYEGTLDEQGKDYLQRIRAATQRMGRLIDDLLALSRVTRSEMRRETVNLSALAESVMDELQRAEPQRLVEVAIQPGLQALGDPQLLRIVLVNLLSNARKFAGRQPQPRIEFGAMPDADGVPAYFVRDNGAGFDMAYANKLFGAFQRLHSPSEFPGTGIGLATVQRIVQRHGGQVFAEGVPGQGATFSFTLPA